MSKDKRAAMVGTLVMAIFLLSLILGNPGKALAVSAFLKIDGIEGESQDNKHKNEIEVISWSFGETNTSTTHTGSGGAGKVNMQDFKFTMRTNKASPKLFQACASGEHLKKAVLTVRSSSSKAQVEFLKTELSEVQVTSFVSLGSSAPSSPLPNPADVYPTEEIMLNFATIKITYYTVRPDGTLGPPVEGFWNMKTMSAR